MTSSPPWPRRLLVLLLAATATSTWAGDDAKAMIARIEAPQPTSKNDLDTLELPALLARLKVPGVSIAVIKDFKLHWAKAYGVADAETGRLVDPSTRFQSASLSKPVTALAAMRLVQEGRFTLDADINTMLKSWKVPRSELTRSQPVTPRALLSHTSGADDGFDFPGYDPTAPLPTLVQILDGRPPSNVGNVAFARAPYEAYKYSGGGLTILQLALTEVSGDSFAPFMHASVLSPLHMTSSSFEQPRTVGANPNAAFAHDQEGRRMGPPWRLHPEQAAAGLWTTPGDLAKFVIEVQTALRGPRGKVLEQQSAREMTAPFGVGPFGLGLKVEQHGEGWYFSHSGANWGYRAWMTGHLRKGYGMVIMTNSDGGMALMNQVAGRVSNAYGWDQDGK